MIKYKMRNQLLFFDIYLRADAGMRSPIRNSLCKAGMAVGWQGQGTAHRCATQWHHERSHPTRPR